VPHLIVGAADIGIAIASAARGRPAARVSVQPIAGRDLAGRQFSGLGATVMAF